MLRLGSFDAGTRGNLAQPPIPPSQGISSLLPEGRTESPHYPEETVSLVREHRTQRESASDTDIPDAGSSESLEEALGLYLETWVPSWGWHVTQ